MMDITEDKAEAVQLEVPAGETEKSNENETPKQIRWMFMEIYGSSQRSSSPIKKPSLERSQSLPTSLTDNKKRSRSSSKRIHARRSGSVRTDTNRTVYRKLPSSHCPSNGPFWVIESRCSRRYRKKKSEESRTYYNRPLIPRYSPPRVWEQESIIKSSVVGSCKTQHIPLDKNEDEDGLIGLAYV